MTSLVGHTIGRYRVIEELGQGGMATVYKAYDDLLEREVAIKLIRVDAISQKPEETVKRFAREARALAKLHHLHIVSLYDYGEYEGAPYLVMEILSYGSLKDRIGTPYPYPEAARILLPIARALDYAHQNNIIHRDVKPANILISEHGDLKLSDFGIAKILGAQEAAPLTGTGVGIGTPEYMSPEQWQGKAVAQTDIYALGVVFFELLTGVRPYQGDTLGDMIYKQATEPPPLPSSIIPQIPEQVDRVLEKALAKTTEERFASAADFAQALEELAGIDSRSPQSWGDTARVDAQAGNSTKFSPPPPPPLETVRPFPTLTKEVPPTKTAVMDQAAPLPAKWNRKRVILLAAAAAGALLIIILASIGLSSLARSIASGQTATTAAPGSATVEGERLTQPAQETRPPTASPTAPAFTATQSPSPSTSASATLTLTATHLPSATPTLEFTLEAIRLEAQPGNIADLGTQAGETLDTISILFPASTVTELVVYIDATRPYGSSLDLRIFYASPSPRSGTPSPTPASPLIEAACSYGENGYSCVINSAVKNSAILLKAPGTVLYYCQLVDASSARAMVIKDFNLKIIRSVMPTATATPSAPPTRVPFRPTVTPTPPPPGSISGILTKTGGVEPLTNRKMELLPLGKTQRTDIKGAYEFSNLPAGNYTVRAYSSDSVKVCASRSVTVKAGVALKNIDLSCDS